MPNSSDILLTARMFREENLDVRTVTMGVHLLSCIRGTLRESVAAVREKIERVAGGLVKACDSVSSKYGIAVVNKRLAVSPMSQFLDVHGAEAALPLAKALDEAAGAVNIDLIGGFTALVHRGMTSGERALIEALPQVLSGTHRVCSSVNVGMSQAGINVDAVNLTARMIGGIAQATASQKGFGAAKLVVFANIPENNPFMAGAYLGAGEAETVIHVGVSGPGVVKRSVERLLEANPGATLDEIAEDIKQTAFRVTRSGELIGREVASLLKAPFGIVDLSLAPTPRVGDSVGEIYQTLGLQTIGAPGTTAAVALVNDAVKKGGAFASSSVGGLSGAFIPVMEDAALSAAMADGHLTFNKLEAMTSVCSVGLDMIAIPGDTPDYAIAGVILDIAAIGVFNRKTTGVRLIPVPGGKVGDRVEFGGLFGSGTIAALPCAPAAAAFVRRGGRLPAPIQSLTN